MGPQILAVSGRGDAMKQTSVLLYAAAIAPLADPERLAAAQQAVSPARREQAAALGRPEDRQRCLAAGLLLRWVLRQLGTEAEPAADAYGKPQIPGGPEISLSHSGDYVLCAAADRPVGCDVQRIVPVRERVARRCLTPAEYADYLAQGTPEARALRFGRYWTLKESYTKALGLGLRLPLRALEFQLDPVVLCRTPAGRDFGFAGFSDLPGYCCALCAAGSLADAALQLVPLPLGPDLSE